MKEVVSKSVADPEAAPQVGGAHNFGHYQFTPASTDSPLHPLIHPCIHPDSPLRPLIHPCIH
eukprot:1208055-Pyramimonas_sp.AAC.1